jgi:hypothetical protein
MLKNFKINTHRDLLVPGLQCYQMGLGPLVDNLAARGLVEEDFKLLPSWNKFVNNPPRNKGLFTHMLEAVFSGKHGHDELNIDHQTNNWSNERRVAMMFLPDGTRNVNSVVIERLAREALPGYEVIVLSGAVTYRGKRITNRNAEKIVKDVVRGDRPVLIIASKLAQRSFSIPQITELYLAYDRGDEGATIQKMSRVLTPDDLDKVGKVISLSFDPNRDDKFDGVITETALNIKNRMELNSTKEAMRIVLSTMDIFSCQPDGAVKILVDDYLKHAMERKGITRVIGSKLELHRLDKDAIAAMASGNRNYMRSAAVQATPMGKTYETIIIDSGAPVPRVPQNQMDKKDLRDLAKAREVALTILENLDIIVYGTGQKNIHDAMATVEADTQMRQAVEEEFGVPFEIVQMLFSTGVINQTYVEFVYDIL